MRAYRYPHDDESEADRQALEVWLNIEEVELPYTLAQSVMLYAAYQNHHLPRAGGILDQPARFQRLLNVMNQYYANVREDDATDIDFSVLHDEDNSSPPNSNFGEFMRG